MGRERVCRRTWFGLEMGGGEAGFAARLLEKVGVDKPWLAPKTWESIPSHGGKPPPLARASPSPEFMAPISDPLIVSETALVRLVLNALQGVKSAIDELQKASSVFSQSLADRNIHRNPKFWHRSSSMSSLGSLLESIAHSGLVFFLLRKFVNYFLGMESRERHPEKDQDGKIDWKRSSTKHFRDSEKDECSDYPPFTLVNQAFAVALRKILEGYICALNTVFASIEVRRSSKIDSQNSGGFPNNISEITLLEVYLHTRELRTRIEVLGHLCGILKDNLEFSKLSAEEFSSVMDSVYSSFPRGADLLTYLYVQTRDAESVHLPLLKFLFLRTYEPYSVFIRTWIFKGTTEDPYKEFFVESSGKSTSCDSYSDFVKERHHTMIPYFLKPVLTPLLRAGQQLLVLMKLQELRNFSVTRNLLYRELASLEDVLPCWSDSSYDSSASFFELTFNKKDAEAMMQKREIMYEVLQEKLKIYFENLDVGLQSTTTMVTPYDDILLFSDDGDQSNGYQVPNLHAENLPFSFSSSDGVSSRDAASSDSDSSSTSVDSPFELTHEKLSEDVDISSESSTEFKFTFLSCFSVESTTLPSIVSRADEHIEQTYQPLSPSDSSTAEFAFDTYSGSDYYVTSIHGRVNPGKPSCKRSITSSKFENPLIMSSWVPQRMKLLGPDETETSTLNNFILGQSDKINTLYASGMKLLGPNETETSMLNNFILGQSDKINTLYDSGMSSARYFSSLPWIEDHANNLSRNPVLARLPWLHGLRSKKTSSLPYFDFSSPEEVDKAFSRRIAHLFWERESEPLQDHHHHLSVNQDSDRMDQHQENKETGVDSSSLISALSCSSHLVGHHSKDVNGGAGWEWSLRQSCVGVSYDSDICSCCPAGTSDLPLDVVIDRCIVMGVLHQYAYISNLTIKLLEEGFHLHEHLSALRRYYFMEISDWADSFIVSMWNHNWSDSNPGDLTAELQRVLMAALQRSACESDPFHERLYIHQRDRSVSSLSFSAIGTFNLIGLGYRVDWPISIIVTNDALEVYSKIFSFLLEVRLSGFSLSSMWRSLKSVDGSNTSGRYFRSQEAGRVYILMGIRQQISHFVSSLQQYLQSQLSDISCSGFLSSVKHKVNDMMDMESVHMSRLTDAQNICFLSDGAGEISKILKNILQCGLDLCGCFNPSPLEVNLPKALAVEYAFEENLRELYLLFLHSPKHSGFNLCRFWSYLDYNGYYSSQISQGRAC
ncbi:spc97 / Spc98 family of spindle pole body (SBP) component [Wolffia australiana]